MKKLLALVIATVCTTSSALPLAWDPFNYAYSPPTSTNLVGRSNPGGFTWYQAGPTTGGTNVPSIYPGNLSYPGRAPSTGNAIKFGGIDSGGMAARFSMTSGSALATSNTIYVSYIMKVTDITGLSASGVFCAGFNNSASSQTTIPNTVACRLYARAVTGGFNLGTSKSTSQASDFVWDTAVHTVNETNFIVQGYQFVSPGTSDDVCQMWINPDASTFNRNDNVPAPTVSVTTGSDIGVSSFCVFNRNAGEFKEVILDQLTIGTSWAEVTLTN